jgi:hypothetical protein
MRHYRTVGEVLPNPVAGGRGLGGQPTLGVRLTYKPGCTAHIYKGREAKSGGTKVDSRADGDARTCPDRRFSGQGISDFRRFKRSWVLRPTGGNAQW